MANDKQKKFEFFEHTADAKFRAYGENLCEAFSNAALALFSIMTDISKVSPEIRKQFNVKSSTRQALLYDFLEELVYFIDTDAYIVCEVESIEIKKEAGYYFLTAKLIGDIADKYEVHTQIKAITYNDMLISEQPGFVMVQVVPDI